MRFSVFSNFTCNFSNFCLVFYFSLKSSISDLISSAIIYLFPIQTFTPHKQFKQKACYFKQNYFHLSIWVKQWNTQIFVNFTVFPKVYLCNKTPSLPLEKLFSRFLIKLYLVWTKGTSAEKIYHCYEKFVSTKRRFNRKHRKIKGRECENSRESHVKSRKIVWKIWIFFTYSETNGDHTNENFLKKMSARIALWK